MYGTRAEYREAWGKAYAEDPPIPLNVDIELASVCNLSCPFCFISDSKFDEMIRQPSMDGKQRRRLMPTQMAMGIIDQAAELGVPALKFNWRGESTLHPEYGQILAFAASYWRKEGESELFFGPGEKYSKIDGELIPIESVFHELLVNTNANCKDEAIRGLMAATKVMVSLDSLVPETYAIMRRGGSLERAKEVIKELIRRKHPGLWVRRVLAKENLHEDFASDVRREFGEWPKVSEHYCFDRNERSSHENPGCDHDSGEVGRTYCGYPSQRIVVSSSGLCYPCCIDLHEEMPVGDINKQTLKEIWEGEPMRRLRGELRAGKFSSKACATCQSWMAYKAPQREFVQDVEVKR